MDSRRIFQFRFVDRYDSKKVITDFLNNKSGCNTLWLSGSHGIGKTRLINKVFSECLTNKQQTIIYTFDANTESDELKKFLELLQETTSVRFIDFLKNNYTSLFDISKQITAQILKIVGIDLTGFVSAL